MLQTLRENPAVKKVVLWLVVAAMVLGIGIGVTAVLGDLIGSGRDTSVASGPWAMKIGSVTVSPLAFESELRAVTREFDQQGLGEIPQLRDRLRVEAEQRIIRRTLEAQESRKAGIRVSDREVSDRIVALPELQQNGRFIGADEYRRLLARNDLDVVGFEAKIRDAILIEKWEALVGAGAIVTDEEVDAENARRGRKVRYDFVLIEPAKYAPAPSSISDAEIQSYYAAHPDRYQRVDARQARYVLFDVKDSDVAAPTDDEIKKAYEADRAKYTGSLEESRQAIVRQILFSRTQAENEKRAKEFRTKAGDVAAAFEKEASAEGLNIQDTGLVRRDISGITRLGPEFHGALFKAPAGSVQGPVRTLKGIAVFVPSDAPSGRATVDEARSDIVADMIKDRAAQAAMLAARRAVAGAGEDLALVGKSLGAEVHNGTPVSRGEPVELLGNDPEVEKVAFAAQSGKIADPVTTASGSVVVLKVVESTTTTGTELAAARDAIRSEILRTRERALVNSVLEDTFRRADYKRNEEYFKQLGS